MQHRPNIVAGVLPQSARPDIEAILDLTRPYLETAGALLLVAVFWGLLLYGAVTYALP